MDVVSLKLLLQLEAMQMDELGKGETRDFITELRRETTTLLRDALSDAQLHELRSQGQDMQRDDAIAYKKYYDLGIAVAILADAGLSYLGLGTPPPTPSWGRMLSESQTLLDQAPLLAFWPGACIAVAVLGFNLLGDGLRELLDPKLVERLPAQG